jgi:hypothetical protein
MRYYILLSIFSFLLALMVLTPTRIIAQQLLPNLRIADWQLHNLQGNLWQGQLQASNAHAFNIHFTWELHLASLFSDTAVLQIRAESAHSKLYAQSEFNGLQAAFKLYGNIDSHELSSQLEQTKPFSMTGSIVIQQLLLTDTPPYYIATGILHWAGGKVSDQQQSNNLPALDINLIKQNNTLHIKLIEQSTQFELINIQAQTNKQADIQIRQRLLSLTEQATLSDNEQDIVMRFTEDLTF